MHDILENLTISQLIVNISNGQYISYLGILPIFDYGEAIYGQVSLLFLMSWMCFLMELLNWC